MQLTIDELRARAKAWVTSGKKQSALAELAGVSTSQVNRLLKGKSLRGEAAFQLWNTLNDNLPSRGTKRTDSTAIDPDARTKDDFKEHRPPPFQQWSVEVVDLNTVEIPDGATLLVDWLTAESTIECLGILNAAGGRRVVPCDLPILRSDDTISSQLRRFEKSLDNHPINIQEIGTDREQLARYLASRWSIRISPARRLVVTNPKHAIFPGNKLRIVALFGQVLELYGPWEGDQLDEDLRGVAPRFFMLLEKLTGSIED